jgi:hypothetical protein
MERCQRWTDFPPEGRYLNVAARRATSASEISPSAIRALTHFFDNFGPFAFMQLRSCELPTLNSPQ